MALLVLVRHGESQWNLENRFTGWVDVPLTETGRREAARAGELLKGTRFDLAYSSVLVRANETLDIILRSLARTDLPVIKDQALNERHYGELQGLNKAETAKKYGDEQVHIWRRSYDVPPPGGESLKDTAARTLPYYDRVIAPQIAAGKNVLVVAHGNSLRSIVMQLDHLTREQVLELNIPTGVPIVYDMAPDLTIRSKRILGQ
ncbi:MAG TPA: 2,3-bisphosphoglycerate-dependent phosphoglycerate mutase [Candidatus Dormibacteraeota bacterium]|nr:2,3-bisphosphoglycerate-dependent phosphoglycerate mutase [Candidatus Dormibacteraeota bacterium]